MADKKRTFFGGAAVLMVGSIIVKIIGAVYKIPLGNLLTDEAYPDFSIAYNIYSFFLTISTAGIPIALSKMIAEADTLGRQNQVRRIFVVAFKTFLTLGLISFLAMALFSQKLANMMDNPSSALCIQALSVSALCVCVMAAFRGYFQGHSDMTPTTVSQIIESVCKMGFGLAFAWLILNRMPQIAGKTPERMAAVGAIAGVSIGSVVALVYIAIYFVKVHKRSRNKTYVDDPGGDRAIFVRLMKLAVPITLGATALTIITILDAKEVLYFLKKMYSNAPELITQEAYEQFQVNKQIPPELFMAQGLKGIFDKCATLYNLPSSLMVPFTAALIPAVSTALAHRNRRGAKRTTELALRVSALVALPMGIGLCVLGEPIVTLLYPNLDIEVAAPIMSILGVASIFVCVMLICNSILQANGYINLPILAIVAGGIIKLVLNAILVENESINVQGAAISTLACFVVTAVLDVFIILRVVPSPPNFLRAFGKPLAASLIMGAGAWAVCGLTSNFLGPRIGCVAGILAGGLIYLFLVIFLRVFSKDDLELMPKGDKIARILKIK